jgi:hypothetical protein
MKPVIILAMMLMAIFVSAQNNNSSLCTSAKAHEFDFWMGEWIVYQNGSDKIVGYNTVTSVAGGCGIQENWRDVTGRSIGTSLNKYAFRREKWQQFWIDNSGLTLELEGHYADNKMILSNPTNRITWFNNTDGTVRQFWEQSPDNGQTWTVAFDGLYKKK